MSTTAMQMVTEAKSRIQNLSPAEVEVERRSADTVLVDLREPGELDEQGKIEGAVHAPRGMLEFWADPQSPYHRPEFDQSRKTILYCASGGRSALACDSLRALGYSDVAHLDGGLKAWREAGLPVVDATNA